jgi:hypothetical protein
LEFVTVEEFGPKESMSVRTSDNELIERLEDLGIMVKLEKRMESTISRFESVEGSC